jgi:hypothetical protein
VFQRVLLSTAALLLTGLFEVPDVMQNIKLKWKEAATVDSERETENK